MTNFIILFFLFYFYLGLAVVQGAVPDHASFVLGLAAIRGPVVVENDVVARKPQNVVLIVVVRVNRHADHIPNQSQNRNQDLNHVIHVLIHVLILVPIRDKMETVIKY